MRNTKGAYSNKMLLASIWTMTDFAKCQQEAVLWGGSVEAVRGRYSSGGCIVQNGRVGETADSLPHFRQAVLNTVHKILYVVHLWIEQNSPEISTAKYTPENVSMTVAWMPTSSRPTSSRHVWAATPMESNTLKWLLQISGSRGKGNIFLLVIISSKYAHVVLLWG